MTRGGSGEVKVKFFGRKLKYGYFLLMSKGRVEVEFIFTTNGGKSGWGGGVPRDNGIYS